MKTIKTKLFSLLASALFAVVTIVTAAEPPKVGDTAPDFTLNTLDGKAVSLRQETAKQPVVLVVLRGWPGYQCPLCTKQVHEFVKEAKAFTGKARVLMVYPGPAEKLKAHAEEFLRDQQWPKEFLFVTDPDYTFTKAYGLRWDAKGETAYPSTFIVDPKGKVRFAKISKSHGGRSSAAEVIKALEAP
jgi:thioredoxin-dependent peroxiredoxin